MKRRGKNISSYRINKAVTNCMIIVVLPFMYKFKFSIVLVWKLDLKCSCEERGIPVLQGWLTPWPDRVTSCFTGAAGKLKCRSSTAVEKNESHSDQKVMIPSSSDCIVGNLCSLTAGHHFMKIKCVCFLSVVTCAMVFS